jgi:pyridoxamine 5'-phosphate oxidase
VLASALRRAAAPRGVPAGTAEVDERLASLTLIEAAIWRQLECAVDDKQHAWRTPVLATVGDDGPDARTVVLREVDAVTRELHFYADERSAKVRQIVRNPRGLMVSWSPDLSWQLRCTLRLALEMSGVAASLRWARMRLTPAAHDYLSARAPGTVLAGDGDGRDAADQAYFAVLSACVQSIDWLELHRDGHRRAVFDDAGPRWVQP